MTDPLYPAVDPMALGQHYINHVAAMTREALHSKADIAAQLALRDMRIAALEQERDEWKAGALALIDQAEKAADALTQARVPLIVAGLLLSPAARVETLTQRLDAAESATDFASIPARCLIENAVRNAHHGRRPKVRFAHVSEALAVGSTSATALCRMFGLDPDEQLGEWPEGVDDDE